MDAVAKKMRHPDRITLEAGALEKLAHWQSQVNSGNPGVVVTRSNLVMWLIEKHDSNLSPAEIKNLEEKFFDSVKYAKWVVKEAVAAKARGESLNIQLGKASAKHNISSVKGRRRRNSSEAPSPKQSANETSISSSKSKEQNLEMGEGGCLVGS